MRRFPCVGVEVALDARMLRNSAARGVRLHKATHGLLLVGGCTSAAMEHFVGHAAHYFMLWRCPFAALRR
eukprot:11190051-Lingulodinium_polyedra.AAC.1